MNIRNCKRCGRSSEDTPFRDKRNFCKECENIKRKESDRLKRETVHTPDMKKALDQVFNNEKLQRIGAAVSRFNEDTELYINRLRLMSKSLTNDEKALVKKILNYQKSVFVENTKKYN